jgi:hypothetical protein
MPMEETTLNEDIAALRAAIEELRTLILERLLKR